MSTNPMTILELRPLAEADLPFLNALYASTRMLELAATGWTDEQKGFFINSQFVLQHNYYQRQFPNAQFHVIELGGRAIGRLYYRWEENDLHLIDITILPKCQRQHIGGKLIQELINQVRERQGKLLLHVEINNPARDWYLRLGFVPTDDSNTTNGLYQQLQWSQ